MKISVREKLVQDILHTMASTVRFSAGRIGVSSKTKHMPTHAQLGIMFALVHQKSQSIKELATHFGITSSATTQLVNAMVAEGLLMRVTSAQDRRSIRISLTAQGKRRLIAAKHARMKTMAAMFAALSDRELSQFFTLQKKMSDHIQHTWIKK